MTGIVKCADKALTKWDKSRRGHGLLFKMTFRNKIKLPRAQMMKLTFMVILFQPSESYKEENQKEEEWPDNLDK